MLTEREREEVEGGGEASRGGELRPIVRILLVRSVRVYDATPHPPPPPPPPPPFHIRPHRLHRALPSREHHATRIPMGLSKLRRMLMGTGVSRLKSAPSAATVTTGTTSASASAADDERERVAALEQRLADERQHGATLQARCEALAANGERLGAELEEARRETGSLRDHNLALQAQLAEALERIEELDANANAEENADADGDDDEEAEAEATSDIAPSPFEEEEEEEERCCICLDELGDGDLVVRLPCMCIFHHDCVMPQLKSGLLTRCPIDRTQVRQDIM